MNNYKKVACNMASTFADISFLVIPAISAVYHHLYSLSKCQNEENDVSPMSLSPRSPGVLIFPDFGRNFGGHLDFGSSEQFYSLSPLIFLFYKLKRRE